MTKTPPVFDAYQRIFALSMLANAASTAHRTEKKLENILYERLRDFIDVSANKDVKNDKPPYPKKNAVTALGKWEMVWGPAVVPKNIFYLQELQYAKNAAFVAKTGNLSAAGGSFPELDHDNIYVVAIAATNATSIFDWLVEDAKVNEVVEWYKYHPKAFKTHEASNKCAVKGKQYISAGTAIGVSKLVKDLTSPSRITNGSGTKLLEFLRGIHGTNSALIFAGHSLAGALAPTMAKYYHETVNPNAVNPFAAVHAYPTAGATPGNVEFSECFSKACPPLPAKFDSSGTRPRYQYLNVRLWNQYDVVPHAWSESSAIDFDGSSSPIINEIPTLYGNLPDHVVHKANHVAKLSTYDQINNAVEVAIGRATKVEGMEYAVLKGVRLLGQAPEKIPNSFTEFLLDLVAEHINAYTGSSSKRIKDLKSLILPTTLEALVPDK